MGKVLDVLRLAAVPTSPVVKSEEEAETMPFIEVGPKRSITGSPDVLAAAPPRSGAPAPLQRPHGVRFLQAVASARPTRLAPELVAYHAPDGAAARQYRELLESVLSAAGEARGLLFTGTREGAGTTTVVLNLALTAARQGRETVVLDAHLRKPAVAARLGLEEKAGLLDVLGGECKVEEVLVATEQERLLAMPAGRPAALWAGADSLRGLLEELKERFEIILIDGPAWDGRPAGALLAQAAGAVFLVAPAAEAEGPPTSELLRDLPGRGIHLAGCVVAG